MTTLSSNGHRPPDEEPSGARAPTRTRVDGDAAPLSVASSQWSIGSIGSFCSVGSVGSSFSIGSIGSFCSIGSVGSAFSIGSIGSFCSVGSVLSGASLFAVLAWRAMPKHGSTKLSHQI